MKNTRAISALILAELLEQHQPFVPYVAKAYDFAHSKEDKAFITELCFQTLRSYPKLVLLSEQFLDKPFRSQDKDIFCLLLIGLGELDRHQKNHAAIFETVEGCVGLKKPWAKQVLNACLRRYQRQQISLSERFAQNPVYLYQHPKWLIDTIRAAWPEHVEAILSANNAHPPMILWVNPKKMTPTAYQACFSLDSTIQATQTISACPLGLSLTEPMPQTQLPGYDLGWVNVQNASAQLAAQILPLSDKEQPLRVLDACAAPGNKTATLLTALSHPKSHVLAIDVHKKRVHSAQVLLKRLDLSELAFRLEVANARKPEAWWDKEPFDRILLDSPCSGSGVIRRHPDIKCHLTPERLAEVQTQQASLLHALWPLLKPGGFLLYSTCSVLPEENEEQIAQFSNQFTDIQHVPIILLNKLPASAFSIRSYGVQIFPHGLWDGFYYCLMTKHP